MEDLNMEYLGLVNATSMEKKFIKKYKQLPFLWNPNHPDYSNKKKRNAGYDTLLIIFQKYMPNATRFHIRQKINVLRSCYRKDRRKYLASRTLDSDGNIIYTYIPNSWKYHALTFLDEDIDNDHIISEVGTIPDYEVEQEVEYVDAGETESGNEDTDLSKLEPVYLEEHLDSDVIDEYADQKPFKRKAKRNLMHRTYTGHREGVLQKEFNAIGENVACKLQRMNLQQRYLAELLINKVLIKGLKESLTETTDLVNWPSQMEESYNRVNTSGRDESKEIIINSTADQSYEIPDDDDQ